MPTNDSIFSKMLTDEHTKKLQENLIQIEEGRKIAEQLKKFGLGTKDMEDKLLWAEEVTKTLLGNKVKKWV